MDTEAMRARARELLVELGLCAADRNKMWPSEEKDLASIQRALTAAHAEGVREERERCVKIAEQTYFYPSESDQAISLAKERIAAAIRAQP